MPPQSRRRSVVLIRRDNIEHLVMIGGPTDVVIESNIIRANVARRPAWSAAPRPTRLGAELSNRLTPPEVPPPPARSKAERAAPRLMKPRGVSARTLLAPPEEPPPSPQTAHNLDELERQLEAALRHSPALQGRPPVTNPLAVPPSATESARPVAQPDAPIHGLERPSEPRLDAKPEPKSDPKIEPKFEPPAGGRIKLEPKPEPIPPEPEPQATGKPQNRPTRRPPTFYEEMANFMMPQFCLAVTSPSHHAHLDRMVMPNG